VLRFAPLSTHELSNTYTEEPIPDYFGLQDEASLDALVEAAGESLLRFLPLLLQAVAARGERLLRRCVI
jgi:hypothetical protein